MEDERNDLLSNPGSVGQQERNSCGRGTAYTAFSVLVALLLAGQAVTGYFIYQHQNQISKITKTSQELKLKSLAESLPQNPKPGNQMKMSMARVMPMMMMEPSNNGENEMELTNSTEDQVKRVLMRENPLRKFPTLNNTFMENIGYLKTRMDYEDWKGFEIWMHKWLLFQMAQNEAPDQKVKTKCQEEECNKGVHPGKFCPQCDEKGEYLPMQCFHSTGYCWCVYKNGTMIEGTEVRGRPDCTGDNKDVTTPPNLQ